MTTIQKTIIATTIVAAAIGGSVVVKQRWAEKTQGEAAVAGRVSKQSSVFAGYATPEATMQTMVWAGAKRDTNALLASLAPPCKTRLETHPKELRGVMLLYNIVKASHIISKREVASGIMALTVDFEAGSRGHDTFIVTMMLCEGGWKCLSTMPSSGVN